MEGIDTFLESRFIDGVLVYFRRDNIDKKAKSQPLELERMVKLLTNEDFETYSILEDDGSTSFKRRIKNNDNFKAMCEYKHDKLDDEDDECDKYTCLCSEDSCSYLVIIKHIPTNIHFSIGSVCYNRFHPENATEVYYACKAKKCNGCKTPLVFKECKYIKNTNKKCDGCCFECFEKEQLEQKAKERLRYKQIQAQYTIECELKEKQQREDRYNEYIRETEEKKKLQLLQINQQQRLLDRENEEKNRIENDKKKRVYLNTTYNQKDDAKSMGARWDVDKKKWYAPNSSFETLITKYT